MQKKIFPVTHFIIITLAMIFLSQVGAFGEDSLWTTNVKDAMKKASKEKKDLLLDFTGSDWCIWCTRLHDEVFSKEAFQKEAPKHFVLVTLDFPRRKKLPADLKKQNDEWMKKLNITGFPTIYLLDAAGRPFAKTGYQRGGPEKYIEHLNKLRAVRVTRDKALDKAKSAKGIEKAKLLDQAISKMDSAVIFSSYKKIVDEIIKFDPKNKAGLKNKYAALGVQSQVMQLMQKRDLDGALKMIEKSFKDLKPTGQTAQDLYFVKSQILFNKHDMTGAKKSLEAALNAAPGGEKSATIKRVTDMYFSPEMIKFDEINRLIQSGDLDKALKLAEDSIKKMKPQGKAAHVLYFAKGLVLMRKKNTKSSNKAFEKALAAYPQGRFSRYINSILKAGKKK